MSNLKFTLKAWPVVAAATIGLCYLTQAVAGLFGVKLPEQANIELVRKYAGWNLTFAFLCLQVTVLMPAIEECLFRLPLRWLKHGSFAVLSSVLFSAAHYITQPFPDPAFIALFFFGFAQCRLYRRTGRIWCPMLNHALFNITNLVLLFVIPA